MQVQISLTFSNESAQLHRISVCYPEKNIELVSYRGAGLTGQTGSFAWSSAVQSLTILLLRSRLNWSVPHLSGSRGSAAAALEYAITKEPQWLVDLFGSDAAGHALIRRFIRRSNPNLKRPGPAELTVLPDTTVKIEQNGAPVEDLETIRKLHDRLEQTWHSYGTRGGRQLREESAAVSPCKPIEKLYFKEIGRSLADLDIFDRQAVADRISSIVSHPILTELSGPDRRPYDALLENMFAGMRLGLGSDSFLRRELSRDKPIRVAISIAATGVCALFSYLRDVKGYNIEIDNNFAYGVEIGIRILKQDPSMSHDLCAVADVPSAMLLAKKDLHDYSPIMLLPPVLQRILANKSAKSKLNNAQKLASGSYRSLFEFPSTAGVYFEQLASSGTISKDKIETIHREPDEIARDLRSDDPDLRAILFFPYCYLNQTLNNSEIIDQPDLPGQAASMFLFGADSLIQDRPQFQALQIALRDAWYELRHNPAARTSISSTLTGSPDFRRILERCSGFRLDSFYSNA